MTSIAAALLVGLALADTGGTARDSATTVRVGAFVDAHVAWDAARPAGGVRPYTTQPVRHAVPAVNLAHVEAVLDGQRVRGRLALQAGTSVDRNYGGTRDAGVRALQEARLGIRLRPGLWLDGGVAFSHIGQEGWISRDNLTYTRSLVADYTPYYSTGVRLAWDATRTLAVQVHVLNGWQTIRDTNDEPAIGARVDWTPRPALTLGWATFVGNEQASTQPARTRQLHELLARWTPGAWELSATLDAGWQTRPTGRAETWTGGTAIARRRIAEKVRASVRAEWLHDRSRILVTTGMPGGFRTTGASAGLDVDLGRDLVWRSEVRGFRSGDAVWPDADGPLARRTNVFAVTSLALSLGR